MYSRWTFQRSSERATEDPGLKKRFVPTLLELPSTPILLPEEGNWRSWERGLRSRLVNSSTSPSHESPGLTLPPDFPPGTNQLPFALPCPRDSLGQLVEMQIKIQQIWSRARDSAFLTCSQAIDTTAACPRTPLGLASPVEWSHTESPFCFSGPSSPGITWKLAVSADF